jgi:hypothetical protein
MAEQTSTQPVEVTMYQLVTEGNPRYQDGALVAYVKKGRDGWRAFPFTQDQPSRKAWPTPEQAAKRFKRTKLLPCIAESRP